MSFANFSSRRIWAFDQGVAMGAVENQCNAAQHGSCHNFSLEWVAMIHRQKANGKKGAVGKGAQQRQNTMVSKRNIKNAIVTQTAFGKAWGQVGYDNADQMMAKLRQLDVKTVIPFGGYSPAAVVSKVKKGGRTGFVYSFWFTGGGGHSIAFYRSGSSGLLGGGHIYAFDPNLGEFKMSLNEFSKWLSQLIVHYGQHFTPINQHAMKSATPGTYNLRGVA